MLPGVSTIGSELEIDLRATSTCRRDQRSWAFPFRNIDSPMCLPPVVPPLEKTAPAGFVPFFPIPRFTRCSDARNFQDRDFLAVPGGYQNTRAGTRDVDKG